MKNAIFIIATALLAVSCNAPDNSATMKEDANRAKMQRFYDEVFNAHNPNAIDSFCTTAFVDHMPDPGTDGKGIEVTKTSFKNFFAGFPDIHVTTHFIVAHGDTVTSYINMTGTNSGPMMGMAATNKKVDVDAIDIVVLKDGKATDRWGYSDAMKMMQQLGLMPAPGAAPDTAMKPAETKK